MEIYLPDEIVKEKGGLEKAVEWVKEIFLGMWFWDDFRVVSQRVKDYEGEVGNDGYLFTYKSLC